MESIIWHCYRHFERKGAKMFKKIYIEITNVCNLKCKFCPDTKRPKEFINIEKFDEIIRKIHKHTELVCLHVKGEPLLHNKLEDILNILEKYKLKANITTNGTLIRQNLETIKKSKAVRQINFSIHSIMQNEGINQDYIQDIFECTDQIEHIIISYRFWNLQSIKENNINSNMIQAIEKYYNIKNLKQKLAEKDFFKIKDNIFINQDTEFTWPDMNGPSIIENGKCLALKDQIAILVDGTVVPCCLDNNGDIPLGNIFKESLDEILNKSSSITIKKNFKNSVITCNLCKTCGFLKRLEEKRK